MPPQLGLVCITQSTEVRYKTVTRKRLLALAPHDQRWPQLRWMPAARFRLIHSRLA